MTTKKVTLIDKSKLTAKQLKHLSALTPALVDVKIKSEQIKREKVTTRIDKKLWDRLFHLGRNHPEIKSKYRHQLFSVLMVKFLVNQPWLSDFKFFQTAPTALVKSKSGVFGERGGGVKNIRQCDVEWDDVVGPNGKIVREEDFRDLIFTATSKLRAEGYFATQHLKIGGEVSTKNSDISDASFVYSFMLWILREVFPQQEEGNYPDLDSFKYEFGVKTKDRLYVSVEDCQKKPTFTTGRASEKWRSGRKYQSFQIA
ncbi:hypothetical protein AAKU67_004316 [Oxalobacteraceae bacterium GrIS 2.11]